MNKLLPLLAVSYLGAITNLITDAKSVFGALAALASFIASCYAIAIARKKLKTMDANSPLLGEGKGEGERNNGRGRGDEALTLLLPLIAIACFVACSTNGPGQSPLARLAQFPATVLDSAAKLVTTTTTNIVEQAVVTATDVITQDPLTFILTTNTTLATNYALITNIVVTAKPALTKTTEVGETAATFLPPPYGEIAAGIFALASAGLTAAIRRRNAMLKTVITGVEGTGNKTVKENIASASRIMGTAQELHALVKQITK